MLTLPLPILVQPYTNHYITFDHDFEQNQIVLFEDAFTQVSLFLEKFLLRRKNMSLFFPMKKLNTLFTWLKYTSTIPPLIMIWTNSNWCHHTSFNFPVPTPQALPGDYNLNKYECKLSEDPFKTSISFSGQTDFENIFINANKFSTIHNCLPPYILTNLITLHISRNVVSLVVSWMQHFFFEVVNLIKPVKMKRDGT